MPGTRQAGTGWGSGLVAVDPDAAADAWHHSRLMRLFGSDYDSNVDARCDDRVL